MEPHFKTYERLYKCYIAKNEQTKANACIKQAYSLNPNNDKVAYEYVLNILSNNNDICEVKRVLNEILKRNKTYKKAQLLLDSLS
jgi:cytochrome c-type biogenesis protein CcmH/NrfG